MYNHENEARESKLSGNNCSKAIHMAFAKDLDIGGDYPDPRSIDGKCGALLSALNVLDKTGHSDKKEEFEEEFVKRFGYSKCIDLMSHERRCTDYVGESARMIDDILNKD